MMNGGGGGGARHDVEAVFDVPDVFVTAYSYELRRWGNNIKAFGLQHTVELRPVPGSAILMNPDPAMGAVRIGVRLVARVEELRSGRVRLVISPADELSHELIFKHAEELARVQLRH
jgi:hypothetical protein